MNEEDLHAELGYRTTGRRELAQREWFSLRGAAGEVAPSPKAFKALVNRLNVKRWQRANPEKKRAHANRYAAKPEVMERTAANARRRRRDRWIASNPVITCAECGVQFCKTSPPGGLARRFCTGICDARFRCRKARRAAGARAICCCVCGEAGHNARRHK